jgi:hypothetical protein
LKRRRAGRRFWIFAAESNPDGRAGSTAPNGTPPRPPRPLWEQEPADAPGASPFRILDGSITTYLYPVTSATVQYATQTATVHHIDGQANTLATLFQVTRPWTMADTIGDVHLMAYLVVFRAADKPAPTVTGLALQAGGLGVTASAQVDGAPLSVSFKN